LNSRLDLTDWIRVIGIWRGTIRMPGIPRCSLKPMRRYMLHDVEM
jgi:hypothetical protein